MLEIPLTRKEIVRDVFRAFLFTTPLGNVADLDKGGIPDRLRHVFEEKKQPLPPDAKVAVRQKGDSWVITNRDGQPLYVIQKAVDVLTVGEYGNTLWPSPWLEDSRPGMKYRKPKRYTPLLDAVELFDIPDELAKEELGGGKEGTTS